jgi:hypothetical protein
MSSYLKRGGYSKIKSVEIQRDREPRYIDDHTWAEVTVFEVIWVVTTEGEAFSVDILKGETAEEVAEGLRRRGYTNDRCCYYGPAR